MDCVAFCASANCCAIFLELLLLLVPLARIVFSVLALVVPFVASNLSF